MLKSLIKFVYGAALLAGLAIASSAQVASFGDFSGGLNTRNSGILLNANESPDLQNVLLDQNGGVSRREGQSKINSTALGDGASDVNAVYELETSGGNKYCVSFSSTSGYYSTDGCVNNTVFVSTLTRGNDVNCDAYGDRLWCVNNQYNFSFDGTNDVVMPTAPSDLNYIRVWRDRCFGAGKDTQPSRLFWSVLGNCGSWNTSVDYVDIDSEDGDVITGIGQDQYNFLIIYKKYATYRLQFDNANPANRRLINISRSIGAVNHRGTASFDNKHFYLSHGPDGGQPGVYATNGTDVQEDSTKLRGSIDTMATFLSNASRKVIDTKPDWDNGTFDPLTMSSSRDPGFMQSSFTAVNWTSDADFNAMTRSSVAIENGTLYISSQIVRWSDTFDDNDYATGNTTWTLSGGSMGFDNGVLFGNTDCNNGLACNAIYTTVHPRARGTWTFRWQYKDFTQYSVSCGASPHVGPAVCMEYRFAKLNDENYYTVRVFEPSLSLNKRVQLEKRVADTQTQLAEAVVSFTGSTFYDFKIVRHFGTNVIEVFVNNEPKISVIDSSIEGSAYQEIRLMSEDVPGIGTVQNRADDFYYYAYADSATIRTPVFDTAISTPVGGPFQATMTVVGAQTSVDYFVRQSTSPNNDMWTSFAATSDTLRVPMGLRYQQVEANLYTNVSTKTPVIQAFGLNAASTGTWLSNELFLSNGITGWGNFQVDRTVTGSGASITYGLKISTYAGGTISTGTVVVLSGGTINHSTGAYVRVLSTYTVFSASETAKDDSIVINYTEGNSARSPVMGVYRGRLHVCGQSAAGSFNDICFVRDMNGAWTRWVGVNARHLNTVSRSFMVSGASEAANAGFIYSMYTTDSDAGSPIVAYWESKDHVLNNKLENEKSVDGIYLLGSNNATTLTTTIKANAGLTSSSFDIDLSTGAPFKIIKKDIEPSLNGNTYRIRFENNAASKPWSVFGYGLRFRDIGLQQP